MQTQQLKHTELTVSRACLGTMTFGAQCDEAEAGRLMDFCLDSGINFVDTANVYNGGVSETIVGRLLKGRRDRAVLASKVGLKMGDAPDQKGLSRGAILRGIDESLRRLGTDYLDLFYLHLPDYTVPIEETLRAMEDLVRSGKVRYPAASNYAAWQMAQMHCIAAKEKLTPIRVTQPMYNLLARGIEQEYLPMAKEFELSNIVYNPLAGGLLTGKHSENSPPLAGTRFDTNKMYLDRYWHAANRRAVSTLAGAASDEGRSLVSLSLNWLWHHTAADCIILGASSLQQLRENVRALDDGPLSPKTLEACDAVWSELRGVSPVYNR